MFLDEKLNIHLSGFYCSSNKTIASTLTGTPITIAPEIINGQPYTNKVDIFSLGCLWFWLLTGKYPFLGDADSFDNLDRH